jgi:hypothetical protein
MEKNKGGKYDQQTSSANVISTGLFRLVLVVAFPNFLFPSRRLVAWIRASCRRDEAAACFTIENC